MGKRLIRRFSVAAAAAVLGFALAASEAVLRLKRGPPPSEDLWLASTRYLQWDIRKPFFTLSEGAGGKVWRPNRERSSARPFAADKRPGEKRVFIVGESVAQRLPADRLAEELRKAWGQVDVVNCGMGAYDSYRVGLAVRDLLRYDPDLLVILTGNNASPGPESVSYPVYRVNLVLRKSWLWRSLQDEFGRAVRRPATSERLQARFERNLRAMLREARRRRVPVVICTLPANRRDYPPLGELPLLEQEFFSGWMARQEGRSRDAVLQLDRFTRRLPADPMGHFFLGRALEEGGRAEEADREYEQALELDFPDRATKAKNDLIRRVAAEEGARMADVERLVRARSPGGIPGWESFIDGVHWRHHLDPAICRLIAAAARGEAGAPGPEAPRRPRPGRADPRWTPEESLEVSLRAVSDSLQVYAEYDPPFLSERAVAEFMAVDGSVRLLLDDPARAEALFAKNQWTDFLGARAAGLWPGALVHAAEAYGRRKDYAAALDYSRRAERAAADPALPRLVLARALFASGRTREGRGELADIPPGRRERPVADLYERYYQR